VDWFVFAIQWLHVLAGITWFGAVIYNDFILIPAFIKLPVDIQRAAGGAIGAQGRKVILPTAAATIVLGIIRGTFFGPVRSLDVLFGTAYGITWLVALLVAIVVFFWGVKVIGAVVDRFNEFDMSRAMLADGRPSPEYAALVVGAKRAVGLELLLFLVIFTCMVLMRFGL
jgi:uncharacterized membrane protein